MSRRHRKIYKRGKAEGYALGYAQGLHDGNPFVAIAEGAKKMLEDLSRTINDPEFLKTLEEANNKLKEGGIDDEWSDNNSDYLCDSSDDILD